MNNKISYLTELGQRLQFSSDFQQKIHSVVKKNPWFIPEFVSYATNALIHEMLNEAKLTEWLNRYKLTTVDKTIGLILAGNLPLVGFHDFLCCYVTGTKVKIKLSSKDDELFTSLLKILCSTDKELSEKIEVVERLKDFDAVIATGSNNTNRYFEYYFRSYPKILRRNRNSVAILTGKETSGELEQLSDDIFLYFGFGCRNVSKLYIPTGYNIANLFPHFNKYKWLFQNNKYMNNYDYNRTLLMLNKVPHLTNDFVTLTENPSIPSPVSVIHYEYWTDEGSLKANLTKNAQSIQCIVANLSNDISLSAISTVPFGQSQHPALWDYADGVDTMKFLLEL